MLIDSLVLRRASFVAAAAVLLLGGSACGRRGPLQAPSDAAAPPPPAATAPVTAPVPGSRAQPSDRRLRPAPAQRTSGTSGTTLATQGSAIVEDAPDDEDDEEGTSAFKVSPSPKPRRSKSDYVVPKEPFVLDALL